MFRHAYIPPELKAYTVIIRVSDPYSFYPDPDPDSAFEAGYQSGSGSRSNPDPGL
jgi:hypothetical protein